MSAQLPPLVTSETPEKPADLPSTPDHQDPPTPSRAKRPELMEHCEAHSKKLEAFCDSDKKMICIECILLENHRNHDIIGLEKAVAQEKAANAEALSEAFTKQSDVQH